MNELEDKINSILENPEEMEKISRMASELFGIQPEGKDSSQSPPDMSGMMSKISAMMGGGSEKAGLLNAISPYLSEHRRRKLQKSMRLAQMLRLAGKAFGEGGGDDEL